MIIDMLTKGVDLMPPLIPQEWQERTVIQLDQGAITVTFKNGIVSLTSGEVTEAESIVKLTNKRLCDAIDGSTDFMKVWSELAEPSPTDRSTILRGTGAKLITLIDLLARCYKSNPEFKKLLDDYKAAL